MFESIKKLLQAGLKKPTSHYKPAADGSINGPGLYACEVVGESSYQKNLIAVCGPYGQNESQQKQATAVLVPEPTNPYDKNAVAVQLSGRTVGYLSRETARSYCSNLKKRGLKNARLSVAAVVRGGWINDDGEIGMYGVWLDLEVTS